MQDRNWHAFNYTRVHGEAQLTKFHQEPHPLDSHQQPNQQQQAEMKVNVSAKRGETNNAKILMHERGAIFTWLLSPHSPKKVMENACQKSMIEKIKRVLQSLLNLDSVVYISYNLQKNWSEELREQWSSLLFQIIIIILGGRTQKLS